MPEFNLTRKRKKTKIKIADEQGNGMRKIVETYRKEQGIRLTISEFAQ